MPLRRALGAGENLHTCFQLRPCAACRTVGAFRPWPALQPQLLILAARLQEDVRSGAVQANAQVLAFLKEHAAPTAAEVLRDDDTFDFLAELAYDSLPRPVRRRVKLRQVVEFCRKQREKLLAALDGEDDPPEAPPARPLKALPPPSDG